MIDKKQPAPPTTPNAIDGPHEHNPQPELDQLANKSIAPSSLAGAKSHALPSQQALYSMAKGHTLDGKVIGDGLATPSDKSISPKIIPNHAGLGPTPIARHISEFESKK